jgi:hypothetical protein
MPLNNMLKDVLDSQSTIQIKSYNEILKIYQKLKGLRNSLWRYKTIILGILYRRRDLNPRHMDYDSIALTN